MSLNAAYLSRSISIVIPTYNMGRFLPDALQSICENLFGDLEIIIIDDGSTDDTAEVLKHFKAESLLPVFYHRVSHGGKSSAVNHVMQDDRIHGEYIVFLDADDVLPPGSLQKRVEAIANSSADMVVGEFAATDIGGKWLECRRLAPSLNKEPLLNKFYFAAKTPFHLNAAIISKKLMCRTGRFDESLARGQEVDYAIRLLKHARSLRVLPEVVYHYRKYRRPAARRINIRLQTMYGRLCTIHKHLRGVRKVEAILLHAGLDFLKMGYELTARYRLKLPNGKAR